MLQKIKENSIFWSLLFLGLVILTIQLDSVTLRSVDGAVYSSIARELSEKPFFQWIQLTWKDGVAFYENPHFMPMYLALFIRAFGISSYTVIIPIIILSLSSLICVYKLGKTLVSKNLGLFAMFALLATPQFIKEGRNPMLETGLMCFTLFSIYFGIKSLRDRDIKNAILSGVMCAMAFLAKGPISLLAPGVLFAFAILSNFEWANSKIFKNTAKELLKTVLLFLVGFVLIMGIIDLWYFLVTGESFWVNYYQIRLLFTMNHPTAGAIAEVGGDPLFYLKLIFKKHIPWAHIAMASIFLTLFKKDTANRPALLVGGLMTLGYLLGFSIIIFKAPWYINVYFGGLALLSGVSLNLIFKNVRPKLNTAITLTALASTLLLVSSSFPTIFKKKERIVGTFLANLEKKYENRFQKKTIAACYTMGMWRGNFIVHYFLGARLSTCNANADLKFVNLENYQIINNEKLLYSYFPMGLVERVKELK
ncbi:hypothetical protein A9Q84_05075 [Halobacteriovorax marinus]|uniref:Glycosyltransferase RgtA/B/C/D-like domain-containing protein n=1 Tax=Halobacteriovorax marinus TaxID=97084 RepID=A0A1Y5FB57_9BACT|nr:hypothetical protein A9Q84_05075 [Halobacteriovorax marinus]